MTNDELNKYIYHYLTEDKTHSAIMLTGDWGTGKSFYIQNELKPFLEEKHDVKCIIVSLYGLKDIFEVSKALYLECRAKFLNKDSEKAVAGKFAAKTIVKGVTSFFGIDLSKSAEEMEELYNSVDLSGKLIILEDLERSGIDILDVLGYVNNLVEQDGVKVLLVANENEIIKKEKKLGKDQFRKDIEFWQNTEETEKYLRTKEKTVSDTLKYNCNFENAIEGILRSFDNKIFEKLLERQTEQKTPFVVGEIIDVMNTVKSNNLRSVIFGCQKTADLFACVDDSFNKNFLQSILLSNIAFALRMKSGTDCKWDQDKSEYSPSLGTYKYPLALFSYNYILHQFLRKDDLLDYNKAYCVREKLETTKSKIKEHLDIIYKFYCESEESVISELKYIADNLEKTEDIPNCEFGRLANYLVTLHHTIGCDDDIARCKNAMVIRLRAKGDKEVEKQIQFHSGYELESDEEKQEFAEWKEEMLSALREINETDYLFDYMPESVSGFHEYVCQHENDFLAKRRFAKLFDVEKMTTLIEKASSSQIHDIRGAFLAIYHFLNIAEYYEEDKDVLSNIKHNVDKLISDGRSTDKIKILQLKWFSDNLQSFIDRL